MIIISEGVDGKTKLCAEPSPDVGEAFSSAFAAGLQVAAQKGDDTSLGVSGQTARQAATAIAPLLYRTQGLQLYRDSRWALCNDLLSGYITEAEYGKEKATLFLETLTLIKAELTSMSEAQKEFFKNVKAGGTTVDVDTVTAILEAAKPAAATLPSRPTP